MSIDILEPQVRAPLAISAYDPAESLIQPIGWNPLNHKKGGGTPMGGKKRGGSYSVRGGRGRRPSPLHYMDSGLDGLNTMFPTAASMPYDPFYLKNVAQQAKNMDPNAFDPNWKNKIHNPKLFNVFNEELGEGWGLSDYVGPLAAPSGYDSSPDYDTGFEYHLPVQEYASSSYRPSVNVDYYGL
jgi:hypothetical protein